MLPDRQRCWACGAKQQVPLAVAQRSLPAGVARGRATDMDRTRSPTIGALVTSPDEAGLYGIEGVV